MFLQEYCRFLAHFLFAVLIPTIMMFSYIWIVILAPRGFFKDKGLYIDRDQRRLFVSQDEYYDVLDVKTDNRRASMSVNFLKSRGLQVEIHRVCKSLCLQVIAISCVKWDRWFFWFEIKCQYTSGCRKGTHPLEEHNIDTAQTSFMKHCMKLFQHIEIQFVNILTIIVESKFAFKFHDLKSNILNTSNLKPKLIRKFVTSGITKFRFQMKLFGFGFRVFEPVWMLNFILALSWPSKIKAAATVMLIWHHVYLYTERFPPRIGAKDITVLYDPATHAKKADAGGKCTQTSVGVSGVYWTTYIQWM